MYGLGEEKGSFGSVKSAVDRLTSQKSVDDGVLLSE